MGSTLIREWLRHGTHTIIGIDNLVRSGSEYNRAALRGLGVHVHHGDIRLASDVDAVPAVDVVVDAAANPSVLAGVDGRMSSRQLVEHNLAGTLNVLEYCRSHHATFVMLSTSRVYAMTPLARLPLRVDNEAFQPDVSAPLPPGVTIRGIDETFATTPPVSLYGATKLASEALALEYGSTFGFPVWVNRCGVLAGAGQFGRADQGIFAYWIHRWLRRQPLRYIGFGGRGHQVRDCLHPADLRSLVDRQLTSAANGMPRVVNVGGGPASARSLAQLSAWCRERLDDCPIEPVLDDRTFDIPWIVLDTSLASDVWQWSPTRTTDDILEEILQHAHNHPEWLEISGAN